MAADKQSDKKTIELHHFERCDSFVNIRNKHNAAVNKNNKVSLCY